MAELAPKYQVEALLFASGKTISEDQLCILTKLSKDVIKRALKALQEDYEKREGAVIIWNDDTGWKMTVRDAYVAVVKTIVADAEMSRACMETLSVIAYKHPNAMQSEVVDIRGSGAYEHIAELERLGFVARESSGRSYKLKLTEKFFNYFDVAGGKEMRNAFKDVKLPTISEPGTGQQMGGLSVVPVAKEEKQQKLGMQVVEVGPVMERPPAVAEKNDSEEDPTKPKILSIEESAVHRAFLDDLDKRIDQLASRNNERDQDAIYAQRMSAQTDAQAAEGAGDGSAPVEGSVEQSGEQSPQTENMQQFETSGSEPTLSPEEIVSEEKPKKPRKKSKPQGE